MKKLVISLFFLVSFAARGSAPVVFMTDFGLIDDAVAICKGVMLGVAPDLTIVDLSHDIPAFAIEDAARFLAGAAEFYPKGTVFVTVVDPGVGSTRKAIAVKSKKGHYFVLPDNGLITLVASRDGLEEMREIQNVKWMLTDQVSSTFHGRDIFSPVAAHLAKGDSLSDVGPPLAEFVKIDVKVPKISAAGIDADVIALDGPYGNVITNIRMKDLESIGIKMKDTLSVTLGKKRHSFVLTKTFSDVPKGKPLFYIDSKGFLALAVNLGNFAKQYRVTPPAPISIQKK